MNTYLSRMVISVPLLSFLFFIMKTDAAAYYVDVTQKAGIRFVHSTGALGQFHVPETMGSGAVFLDYDNDGDLDLYLVNSGDLPGYRSEHPPANALYENDGAGHFLDVTRRAGVGHTGYGMGAIAADYDNDGDQDLFVTNFGPDVFYRNNGDGTFTDITEFAGVGDPRWGASAAFFDYDLDGWLDLYLVHYLDYTLETAKPCRERGLRTYCHPRHFEGMDDVLYHNNGDGTFTDVTREAGVYQKMEAKGLGVVTGDYNNDGLPDIYVANDDTRNFLYQNLGDGRFRDVSLRAGVGYSEDGIAEAGMGTDMGDYDNDGWLDIFVTNLSYEMNRLYRNNHDGTFTDMSYAAHVGEESLLRLAFGTQFIDYDNDGDLDLFVANGHLLPNIGQMTDTLSYAQPNQLFRNEGDGTYLDVSSDSGDYFQRAEVSRGVTCGDYDNDGDMDILVMNSGEPATLLRNEDGNRNHWLSLRIVGTHCNRDGIGARITVTAGSRQQIHEARRGSGYLSSSDPRMLIGLGDSPGVDRLEIRWPDGQVDVIEEIPVDRALVLKEGEGLIAP